MRAVAVHRLEVGYNKGRTVAVGGVSFEVAAGECCVLLGPSGCGKTTLLNSIAGLIRPDRGEVVIADKVMTSAEQRIHVPPQDRNIAMVFQEYALYPHLTVRKNLAFPLETQRMAKDVVEEKVTSIANLLGIETLLDRRPAQLSGGQRQRVALGRALVRDPDVFLLDEPMGNIDAKLRIQLRLELKRIQRQVGVTMIYVTHDQVEAMAMADQIVLMKDGHVEQMGAPEELYDTPCNMFVAGFLGTLPINFITGRLSRVNGSPTFETPSFKLPVPERLVPALADYTDGAGLVLGVRPADLKRVEGQLEGAIRVEVDVAEQGGDTITVHGKVGETFLTARWIASEGAGLGREVWVTPDDARIHLFDSTTELAIR